VQPYLSRLSFRAAFLLSLMTGLDPAMARAPGGPAREELHNVYGDRAYAALQEHPRKRMLDR
jgi:hypothetical protein